MRRAPPQAAVPEGGGRPAIALPFPDQDAGADLANQAGRYGGGPRGTAARPRPDGNLIAALALVAVVCLLFSILPFGRLIQAALAPAGVLDPSPALGELTSRAALRATWHTLETSLASSAIALALGTVVALALVLTDAPGRRAIAFLFVLSTLIAPQVTALAFASLAGPSSPLLATVGLAPPPGSPNPLIGREGIILVLGLHHAPLVFITLQAGLRVLPRDLLEAARIAGARPGTILAGIVLPLLRPYLVASGALAFVASVGNFGIPALLGMPVNYLTLPTLIYRRLTSFGPSIIGDAAALSLLVALIAGAGVVLAGFALGRGSARVGGGAPVDGLFTLSGPHRRILAATLWALLGIVLLLPFASLFVAALVPTYGVALTPETVTLANFAEVLLRQDVTVRALRNSFLLSLGAALLLALIAVPLAHALDRRLARARRPVEALIEIPYALPGIVLAIACILLFLRPLPVVGVSLYGTPFIILFAYLARFLPMALKAPAAAVAQLPPDQEEAARICGARAATRLRTIVFPAVAPAAAAGALLVFLTAFNELTVSALLWSAGTETIGVALFSLEEAGLISEASAIALTAVAVITVVMLVLDGLAGRLPRGVLPWRP